MNRSRWALVAVALATFMTYLDNNIVNVAIPDIQRELGLSTAGIEWVVSGYILTFAGLLLAGGRLADRFGRRRLFLVGLAVFTVSSLLAGFAGGPATLIARPRPAGNRCRGRHPDDAGHHQRDVHRPARAERGGRDLGRRRRTRPCRRPGAGRAPDPARLVGVDLLDQRAGRHRDHGARRLGHHGVARGRGTSHGPGRSRPVDGHALLAHLGPDRGSRPRAGAPPAS